MLTWDEMAERLIPYCVDMGFTHIEFLPVTEYPYDPSWGYQTTGLYSPTARFGEPEGFARFVNGAHKVGLGVILDWVPAHFPTDAHGLRWFDGTALYEHEDPRQGYHPDWNTAIYNFGRAEVFSYLVNNALYWAEKFHLDGLRVDAVASMLYLDYSRKHGEWVPNEYGGNENLDTVRFLQTMNTEVYGSHPGIITIAEESTSWPKVSAPVHAGGLGFGFKWNMGFMHDTLQYLQREPIHRKHHHNDLTFGLLYAFSENFVLPLSHDEVVHGKGSLIAKMAGDDWQKFANLRAYYGFMWGYPGKKLLFMGQEFAQWQEWARRPLARLEPARISLARRHAPVGARPQRHLSQQGRVACARLRGRRFRMADCRRPREFGLCLAAQGAWRKNHRRDQQFYPGLPGKLYDTAAGGGAVEGNSQQRCRDLWRQRQGQRRSRSGNEKQRRRHYRHHHPAAFGDTDAGTGLVHGKAGSQDPPWPWARIIFGEDTVPGAVKPPGNHTIGRKFNGKTHPAPRP